MLTPTDCNKTICHHFLKIEFIQTPFVKRINNFLNLACLQRDLQKQ